MLISCPKSRASLDTSGKQAYICKSDAIPEEETPLHEKEDVAVAGNE